MSRPHVVHFHLCSAENRVNKLFVANLARPFHFLKRVFLHLHERDGGVFQPRWWLNIKQIVCSEVIIKHNPVVSDTLLWYESTNTHTFLKPYTGNITSSPLSSYGEPPTFFPPSLKKKTCSLPGRHLYGWERPSTSNLISWGFGNKNTRRYVILKFLVSHSLGHLASTKARPGFHVPHKCKKGNNQSQLQAGVNAS